jgi:hypothetical protein
MVILLPAACIGWWATGFAAGRDWQFFPIILRAHRQSAGGAPVRRVPELAQVEVGVAAAGGTVEAANGRLIDCAYFRPGYEHLAIT